MRRFLSVIILTFWASATSAQVTGSKGWAVPIPDDIWAQMNGVSWHSDLPCPTRNELSLLHVPFRNFDGLPEIGQMIVDEKLTEEILEIFDELFVDGFQVQSIKLVSEFEGNDTKSMNANNTSAFNCRRVAGTSRMSNHAFGRALDINPVQNPFVTNRKTSPKAGDDFDDPSERAPGVVGIIRSDGPVVAAFKKHGWDWGGDWNSLKDYQHFSKDGG